MVIEQNQSLNDGLGQLKSRISVIESQNQEQNLVSKVKDLDANLKIVSESLLTFGAKLTQLEREDTVIKAMVHKNSKALDETLANQSKIEQFKSTIEEIKISFELFKSQSNTISKNEFGKLKPELDRVKNQLDNLVLDKELINRELERSLKDQTKKIDELGKNIKETMDRSLKECSNTYENQIKELRSAIRESTLSQELNLNIKVKDHDLNLKRISESLSNFKLKLIHLEKEDTTTKAMFKNNSKALDEIFTIQTKIKQFKTKVDEIQSSFDLQKSQSDGLSKSENGKLKTEVEKLKNQLENIEIDKDLINSKELERSLKDQTKKIDDLWKKIDFIIQKTLEEYSNTYGTQINELSSAIKESKRELTNNIQKIELSIQNKSESKSNLLNIDTKRMLDEKINATELEMNTKMMTLNQKMEILISKELACFENSEKSIKDIKKLEEVLQNLIENQKQREKVVIEQNKSVNSRVSIIESIRTQEPNLTLKIKDLEVNSKIVSELLPTLDSRLVNLEKEDTAMREKLKNNSKTLKEVLANNPKIEQFKTTMQETRISFDLFKSHHDISKSETDKLYEEVIKIKEYLKNIAQDKDLINVTELERSLKDQTKRINDLEKAIDKTKSINSYAPKQGTQTLLKFTSSKTSQNENSVNQAELKDINKLSTINLENNFKPEYQITKSDKPSKPKNCDCIVDGCIPCIAHENRITTLENDFKVSKQDILTLQKKTQTMFENHQIFVNKTQHDIPKSDIESINNKGLNLEVIESSTKKKYDKKISSSKINTPKQEARRLSKKVKSKNRGKYYYSRS